MSSGSGQPDGDFNLGDWIDLSIFEEEDEEEPDVNADKTCSFAPDLMNGLQLNHQADCSEPNKVTIRDAQKQQVRQSVPSHEEISPFHQESPARDHDAGQIPGLAAPGDSHQIPDVDMMRMDVDNAGVVTSGSGTMNAAAPRPPASTDDPTVAQFPDLSSVPGASLRKKTDSQARNLEEDGLVYAFQFRQLQLQPAIYDRFYNTLLKLRNKHSSEIKRATEKSIKNMSNLLLRSVGYVIWVDGSEWVISEAEFFQGESRLNYHRGGGRTQDPRFYVILEALWHKMRNIVFELKPPNRRIGSSPSSMTASPASDSNGSELGTPFAADSFTENRAVSRTPTLHYRPPSPPAPTSPSARSQTTAKIEPLAARMDRRVLLPTPMTAEETENALIDLVVRLSNIRHNSNPNVFNALWEQHIMRAEELDEAAEHTRDSNGQDRLADAHPETRGTSVAEPAAVLTTDGKQTSKSNTPFFPSATPPGLTRSPLAPALPGMMSVYITSAPVFSPVAPTPGHIPASSARAYHWPDAPTSASDNDMRRFFNGVDTRVQCRRENVIGWVFSYGWCDGCRFVDAAGKLGNSTGTEEDQTEKDWDWNVVRALWEVFQADLREAARKGINIWRMKVLVLYWIK